ncbi:MAG: hypothetical protein ACM31L_06870, partial [Actinomycetota bacterium]
PVLAAPEVLDLHMGDYTGGTAEVVASTFRLPPPSQVEESMAPEPPSVEATRQMAESEKPNVFEPLDPDGLQPQR